MTTEPVAPAPSGADILFPKTDPPPAEAAPAAPPPEPAEGTVGEVAPSVVAPPNAEGATLAEGEKPALDASPPAPLTLESYDLKLPEGLTVDAGLMDKFKAAALDGALAPDKAQGLLDLYHTALTTAATAQAEAASAQAAEWLTQSNALPELSGEMRKTSTLALGRAFDEYGSPELGEFLATTGVGNNPHLVRYILKMAAALDEGRPAPAGNPANPGPSGRPNGARTPGEILFQSGGPGSAPLTQ